ncbi:hypothetical protein ABG088_06505, partial [Hydrogenibacillus schlegelii]
EQRIGLRFSHLSREGKLKRVEKTTDPLSIDDHSPSPKLGLEAVIAGLRMFPKDGFDLSFERCIGLPSFLLGFLALFLVIPRRSWNAKRLEEKRQGSQPPGQRLLRQTDALLKRKLISLPARGSFLGARFRPPFCRGAVPNHECASGILSLFGGFKELSAFFQEGKLSLQEGIRMNAVFPGKFNERFFAFDPFQSRFEFDGAGDGFCSFHRSPLL